MTLAALRSDKAIGKTLTLAGPKAYTTQEVIAMCEKMADSRAKVRRGGSARARTSPLCCAV